MAIEGNLEYAAARVQAQHGRLPAEADWQSVEASHDLAHYLDSARAAVLADWVSSFDAHQDVHVIERLLRSQWQAHVQRVASWHPREWQPWLRWLAWLPFLPLLVPLTQAETPPAWLQSDPSLGPAARMPPGPAGPPPQRHSALPAALANMSDALSGAAQVPRMIASEWRRRWDALAPGDDDEGWAHRTQLGRAIDQHAAALPATAGTPALRRQLAQRFNALFRVSQGTAVASACHLGRLGLELERLRGGIATRALLGPLDSALS